MRAAFSSAPPIADARAPLALLERLAGPLRSPWCWAALALLAVASAVVSPRFSHDSLFYLDMGEGILAGRGPSSYYLTLNAFHVPNDRLSWPPFYPLLLAVGMAAGLDPIWAVRLVSAASFVATALLLYATTAALGRRALGPPAMALWVLLPLRAEVFSAAWSEPPFIALCMGSLLFLARAVRGERPRYRALVAAGTLAGLAVLTRYLGCAMVATGIACVLYARVAGRLGRGLRSLVAALAAFCIPAAAVAAPWFISSYLRFGHFTTGRPPSDLGPLQNGAALAAVVAADCALPCAIVAAVLLVPRLRALHPRRPGALPAGWMAPAAFVVLYAITLVAVRSIDDFEPIYYRFASPLYAPLALLMLAALAWVTGRDRPDQPLPGASLLALAGGVLLLGVIGPGQIALDQLRAPAPPARPVDAWITTRTRSTDLFIGADPSWVRFSFGRPVLRGYQETPLTPRAVARFLRAHGAAFSDWYVIAAESDPPWWTDDSSGALRLTRLYDDGAFVIYHASLAG